MEQASAVEHVREVIARSGLSQSAFALEVGMDATKMSKALNGRRRFTPGELARIAERGGVSVDWLLGYPRVPAATASVRTPQASPAHLDMDSLRSQIAALCRRYGIAELAVFGSAARGDTGEDSDVDLLYVRELGNDLGMDYFGLKDELEHLLGRPVDLVPKDGLHWIIRDEVLAEAKELYAAA